jgi:hypothetical protein
MGYSDLSRASIRMAHDHDALTVSLAEASRLESELAKHLLKVRKLSLIVDLDQTVMHATVDPTVADWMRDEKNPNYEALKDVKKFRLADEGSRGLEYYVKMRWELRPVYFLGWQTRLILRGNVKARVNRLFAKNLRTLRDARIHHGHASLRLGRLQYHRPGRRTVWWEDPESG